VVYVLVNHHVRHQVTVATLHPNATVLRTWGSWIVEGDFTVVNYTTFLFNSIRRLCSIDTHTHSYALALTLFAVPQGSDPVAQIKSTRLVILNVPAPNRTQDGCINQLRNKVSLYLAGTLPSSVVLPSFFYYDVLIGEYDSPHAYRLTLPNVHTAEIVCRVRSPP
jgi:hypothetical protein